MSILETANQAFTFQPVTPERWEDLETLFGPRGACAGCWCMFFRMKQSEFEQQKGEGNRRALKELVDRGHVPGILAYSTVEDKAAAIPVGWCSVAPREDFSRLARSRILKRVDEKPVWSLVCFYVAKDYRRQGLTTSLLQAAVKYAAQNEAKIVEGYPKDSGGKDVPDVFAYTGLASAFLNAGFVEVERRSETRPIMRYFIEQDESNAESLRMV